ncbi:PAS domain S-box protein [Geobacter hydrogenophilus]|uniref:Signal transduction histidine kinase n=1 Tax=Geobacter hydrogenophilus TaxID=40983 RepID=A0A9W6LCV2_9BACT|nr:PAS domain S-box protein [Geobacter hydrogenophilus]MBT0894371.1 PAS domain S-box protein [Geobacter hydrogenophilus]GLI38340.1 signal transduction histidine kinase [Geobacter hydrogenophilus]
MTDTTNDKLLRLIAEGVPDAVIFADREGIVRIWSPGAERMFGFTAAEAVGQSLDLIIPENLQARHWEGYRRVMETGETHYGTKLLSAPALCNSGSRISTEFSMALVRDCEGAMAGSGAIIRDVTERWQKEKAMKERLAELERHEAERNG